jgi:protein-disulfide isomerase
LSAALDARLGHDSRGISEGIMKKLLIIVTVTASLSGCARKPEPPVAAAPAEAPVAAPVTPPVALSAEQQAMLVRAHSPVLGPANAPVTIVEFLDPACEACRAYAPVVKQVMFLYPEQVRVVVRFADFHEGSDKAIRLLEAARRQGKFEAVLTALFDGQDDWASHHAPRPDRAWELAAATGLDMARARKDAASAQTDAMLRQEGEDLVALQVARTPTFFVNGKPLTEFGAEQLMSLVSAEVKAVAPN